MRCTVRRTMVAVLLFAASAWAQATAPPGISSGKSVAIVIDDSAAAGRHRAAMARSVQHFLRFFNSDDELCIFAAKEKPMLWQDFTSDPDLLSKGVTKLYGHGKLALYDTMLTAARHLQSESGNDTKVLAVFTAGEDNASAVKFPDLLRDPAFKVPVYVMAGPDTDWRIQEPFQVLVQQSGGRAYFVRDEGQMPEVARQIGWRITGRNDETLAAVSAKPLLPYKVLVVPSIPVANSQSTEQVSGGDNVLLHRVLVSRLRKAKLFSEVIDTESPIAGPSTAAADGRLELLATIIGFQGGSQARRELLLFGGGTKLKVQVVLREAGSTQPMLGFVKEATASSGLFGGSDEKVETEAIIRAADQIIAELRKRK